MGAIAILRDGKRDQRRVMKCEKCGAVFVEGLATKDIKPESVAYVSVEGAKTKKKLLDGINGVTSTAPKAVVKNVTKAPIKEEPERKRNKMAKKEAKEISPRTVTALADKRCPKIGVTMERTISGKTCKCLVKENGFEYKGHMYDTPSAVATKFVIEELGGSPSTRRPGWDFFFPVKGSDGPPKKRGRPPKAKSEKAAPKIKRRGPGRPPKDKTADVPATPKKRRGRPPKVVAPEEVEQDPVAAEEAAEAEEAVTDESDTKLADLE